MLSYETETETPEDPWCRSTDWGLIETARGRDEALAREALGSLCAQYWYPLYAYIRRRGYPADRAQDLTQGLFASLLSRNFLGALGPEKGKFRAFLFASCQNFLANQYEHDHARKRGGGRRTFSIDLADAEGRYSREPSHDLTPERLYDRRWTLTLLARVLDRLAVEVRRSGKGGLFDQLKPALLGEGDAVAHAQVAGRLGMSEGAVKVAAHRLRRRYRELLREEVRRTVDTVEEVEDEIRGLFVSLAR